MPRRLFVAVLGAVVLACLFGAPAAIADTFTPESGGSPNADDIDTLYKITLYVGIVIFLLVEGTLIWSLVRHRARRGGPRRGGDRPPRDPARGDQGAPDRGARGRTAPGARAGGRLGRGAARCGVTRAPAGAAGLTVRHIRNEVEPLQGPRI